VLAACSSGDGGGGADLVIEPTAEGWDFQVTTSASSATVAPGAMFTLTAVVSNASGAGEATPASTLTYYQSSDATIGSSDTSLGTDPVAALAVDASDTQDITLTAPMTAGTSYYGACIPATGDELNASDNCSVGVAVTFTSGWDFKVTASVSSASVTGSTPFTLTAEVSNDSGASGPAPASTLTYYQSSDATISSADTSRGTDAVASLAVGASSTESIDLTITAASGTYYFGACMPAASGEADATDNCSSGVAVAVTSGWDFQVTGSVSTTSVASGGSVTVTAVVTNAGIANLPTPESELTYAEQTFADYLELGTRTIPALAVGESSTQTIEIIAPTYVGTKYYYHLCMPGDTGDIGTTGNCYSTEDIDITAAGG
ncbi:MAG: CARDB domain-containing protein, partial [Gammaproteobacteria bacterium]